MKTYPLRHRAGTTLQSPSFRKEPRQPAELQSVADLTKRRTVLRVVLFLAILIALTLLLAAISSGTFGRFILARGFLALAVLSVAYALGLCVLSLWKLTDWIVR